MTRRTCETCGHALAYKIDYIYMRIKGEFVFDLCECDFDGVAVPCNESGVCGRWTAREGMEEEE